MSAGLRVDFDQVRGEPGIHYDADVSQEYRAAIVKGLEDGLAIRFPDSGNSLSIRIKQSDEHPVDSCALSFYLVARCVVEQAYTLIHARRDLVSKSQTGK